MKQFYFAYRSVTQAQRAARKLEPAGIRNTLMRTPKSMQTLGCGYSVRVSERDLARARELLSGYQRIYVQQFGGAFEELDT